MPITPRGAVIILIAQVNFFLNLHKSITSSLLTTVLLPVFLTLVTTSVIDLTFVSSLTTPFTSWESHEDSLGSDHIPSIIRINLTIKNVFFYSHKLNFSELDWKSFQSLLITLAPDLPPQLRDPDISHLDKYEILINSIQNTVLSLIPQKHKNQFRIPCTNHYSPSHKRSPPSSSWWNDTCSEAVELRKQAFRLFKKNPSQENFFNLKRQEASTRKILRIEKRRVGDPFVKRSLLLLS